MMRRLPPGLRRRSAATRHYYRLFTRRRYLRRCYDASALRARWQMRHVYTLV